MSIPFRPIDWSDRGITILDQTLLPGEERYVELASTPEVVDAIRRLCVRGAPLIGIAAAMGLAAEAVRAARDGALNPEYVRDVAARLGAARPTAVNLAWALARMLRIADVAFSRAMDARSVAHAMRVEAQRIWDEDAAMCRAIGTHSAELLPEPATVLTHCNAGALATGGIGTALAGIYVAHERGRAIEVLSTETRPLRQGARLTAWELGRAGIRVTTLADSAAGAALAAGSVDAVITGADRIARNGDVANKVGTYPLAVLAARHGVPFYVAAPTSTVDLAAADGSAIPIEERGASELDPAPTATVWNPAFDVTPAELVSALITDRGVWRAPLAASIATLASEGALRR
ncbi:MAG TPA: S-methyl-5-thioribose-1-phosphate isomerase [Gemmatimonadales bacterium]